MPIITSCVSCISWEAGEVRGRGGGRFMQRRLISLRCNILRRAFERRFWWLITIRSSVYRKSVWLSLCITDRVRNVAGVQWVTAAVNELSIHNGSDLLLLSKNRKENITYKQFTDRHPRMTRRCIMGKNMPWHAWRGSHVWDTQTAKPPTYLAAR